MEKNHVFNHSLIHSPSLLDAPVTEAFASEFHEGQGDKCKITTIMKAIKIRRRDTKCRLKEAGHIQNGRSIHGV